MKNQKQNKTNSSQKGREKQNKTKIFMCDVGTTDSEKTRTKLLLASSILLLPCKLTPKKLYTGWCLPINQTKY